MSKPQSEQSFERVTDLGGGLALYKTHLDMLREQDKNARFMTAQKFERLTENMKQDGVIESFPLAVMTENQHGNKQLLLISGHHRSRAARAAGLTEIHVIVYEKELTADEIRSKQLSHNALNGSDDPQLLKDIYDSITDLDARIAAGLLDFELELGDVPTVKIDEITLNLDYEIINLMFFPKQYEEWEQVLKMIDKDAHIGVIDYKYWDDFAKTIRDVSKREDVRNMTAIVAKMLEIVKEHYKAKDKELTDVGGTEKTKGSGKDKAKGKSE